MLEQLDFVLAYHAWPLVVDAVDVVAFVVVVVVVVD